MKKLILGILTVFTITATQAQGLDLGIKAGVNFATLNDATNLDNRTGFVAGAFVGAKLSDNVGIQADLLYSQQGAEFEGEKFDLNYVNVPVVAKFFVFKGLHIHAGPQFGFKIDDNTQSLFGELFNDAAVKDFDLSGVAGIGYDLPLGIRIEGRYNFGLSDVGEEDEFEFGKNSVYTLSIGYSFL